MSQSTKSTPVLLPLVAEMLTAARPAFRQDRPFQRFGVLVLGLLSALSRHTLTQVLVALGLGELDWSAAYRLFSVPRLDYDALCRSVLRQTLAQVAPDQPYLVALDGTQLPRHSRTMPGTSWLRAPRTAPFRRGIQRAQRFLHLVWLTPPTTSGYSRAIPLRFVPAFPPKAIRPDDEPTQKEWEAGVASLGWLRAELDAAERGAQPLLAIGDGHFSNQHLWRDLPDGITVLARTAKNRSLYALPAPPSPSAHRGRPRKYGERAPTPQDRLAESQGWHRTTLTIRERTIPTTYRVEGPYLVKGAPERPLFLLVVKGVAARRRQHRRRDASCWLVNAQPDGDGGWQLPWSAPQLLAWAWQRWEIEVTHRALKSGFGIGETQAWSPTAAILSVQWRVWVWSVLILAGYRAWGLAPSAVRPLGRWWRGGGRWSFGQLWQVFRQELWSLPEFRPGSLGFPATWTQILDGQASWLPATTGVRRI